MDIASIDYGDFIVVMIVLNIHIVINTCDVHEELSQNTSTILLKGEMNEARQVHLEWTPYNGWDQGVEYYIIEKKDAYGQWQLIRQVDGDVFNFDYQE